MLKWKLNMEKTTEFIQLLVRNNKYNYQDTAENIFFFSLVLSETKKIFE